MLQQILDDESVPCKGEKHLAALTAADRIPWAKAREQYFRTGVNRVSLDTVEKASFLLCLDEDENGYDPVSESFGFTALLSNCCLVSKSTGKHFD